MAVTDTLGRSVRDLRVSVTDRCNFRCTYCMPRERFGPDHAFVLRDELLTFEEIARVVAAFAANGVTTVRLTGGEPLLRRALPHLVEQIAAVPGIDDTAMTTNGVLLAGAAQSLADAGLRRVTVSLDALDPDRFRAMADTTVPIETVLDGVAAAAEAGLGPIKINAVVQRGVNEDQIIPLTRFARDHGYTMRFIEYMDVGSTNGWRTGDVVPADEILATVASAFPVEPLLPAKTGETARRYQFTDGRGEFGIIASVTEPFCGACTRARVSPVGEVFTCLFATRGHDLRGLLRGGADDAALVESVRGSWSGRADRYSELRSEQDGRGGPKVEMSYIGG